MYIYKNYQSLGLDNQPNISLNGVHASASPLEAHVELTNWLEQNDDGDELATADPWVAACSKHLSHLFYKECQKDTNIFDQVEDLDANECLQKLIEIQQQRETWIILLYMSRLDVMMTENLRTTLKKQIVECYLLI